MANTSSFIYLLIFVLLTIGKLLASATLLEDVCRQSLDQPYCNKILSSDARNRNANFTVLAQNTIDLGSYIATSTRVKIHTLWMSEKDLDHKIELEACDENYGVILASLRSAVGHLQQREYPDLNMQGGSAYEEATECEDAFKQIPGYKSPVTDENYRMGRIGEIIAIIANMLIKS